MRIFSGVRPTGELHIGNYLGAIKQWIELQEKNDCVFCIVDLHAITTPYQSKELKKNIFELAIAYLASGLNPEKCIFFVQSQVEAHAELAWLLGTITPIGELQRMTQYKEKVKKYPKDINAGLVNYPILMAADILLYQTDLVPVGKDQQQHVELARTIARKFNQKFGQTFKEPKVLLPKTGAKIMSLQNPKKKMSKTDDPRGCLEVFEKPEEIKKKIMAAVTDPGKVIKYSDSKPGISNLLTIYSLFSGKSISELERNFKGKGYEEFKKSLTKLLINSLEPFRRKRKELLSREIYVKEILNAGAKRAKTIAQLTLEEAKKKMGLI
ncbi:MAG: tryptophan--tRNA ligase [Candidatus Nealsonbacteria bacterium]|nr:MAG: tryptophan--tRNA ligase [Candidatus Nealsonbacteria bacterium]